MNNSKNYSHLREKNLYDQTKSTRHFMVDELKLVIVASTLEKLLKDKNSFIISTTTTAAKPFLSHTDDNSLESGKEIQRDS